MRSLITVTCLKMRHELLIQCLFQKLLTDEMERAKQTSGLSSDSHGEIIHHVTDLYKSIVYQANLIR